MYYFSIEMDFKKLVNILSFQIFLIICFVFWNDMQTCIYDSS